jgi:hypothetical protein
MTLPQALGEDDGDPLLSDINAALLQVLSDRGILDEEALQRAADTLMLASGEITRGSITFRDQVVPTLALIIERFGAQTGARRAGQVEGFMENAALLGLDPNSLAYSLGMNLSTGTLFGGAIDFQGLIVDPFTAAFDDIRAQVGIGDSGTGGGSDLLSGLPDGVNKAIESAGELQTALNEMASREYTLAVNLVPKGEDWLLTAARSGGQVNLEGVVRNNGGQVPGATNRGRGTQGFTPTR